MKKLGASSRDDKLVCPHCLMEKKTRLRSFSDKAWSYLFISNEIDFEVIGMNICDSCYSDLREVLMDSLEEVANTEVPAKISDRIKEMEI